MSITSSQSPRSLLKAYTNQLITHPLRTKCITAGTLCFLQEVLASHIAKTPVQQVPKDAPRPIHLLAEAKVNVKAAKMALYGFLVSAPLGHVLVGLLQKTFAGKKGAGAKVGQILASNLLVAPLQCAVYLACMAIISGAKSTGEVVKTVKAGFMSMIRVQWATSPLALVIAQRLIPQELWVPFFNMIGFTVGLYFSVRVKKFHLSQEKHDKAKDEKEGEDKQ